LSKKDGDGRIDAVEIAERQRHLYLLERVKNNRPLSRKELEELAKLEKKPKNKQRATIDESRATIAADQIVKTQAAAGKYASVSARTIRRWVKNGMPRTTDGCYIKGMLDMFKQHEGSQPTEHRQRTQEAEANVKELKGKLLEIELKIKQGQLIERDKIEGQIVRKVVAVKRALLGLGRKLAPELAKEKNPKKVQRIIDVRTRDIIEGFAGKNDKNRDED